MTKPTVITKPRIIKVRELKVGDTFRQMGAPEKVEAITPYGTSFHSLILDTDLQKGIVYDKMMEVELVVSAASRDMSQILDQLNAKFPDLNAVSTVEWNGVEGGIWFRMEGAVHPDGRRYYSPYSEIHPALEAALEEVGMFAEPYDAGTLMAYRS